MPARSTEFLNRGISSKQPTICRHPARERLEVAAAMGHTEPNKLDRPIDHSNCGGR